jgi:hypothetical protein
MRNGVACGAILYESKNARKWSDDYVLEDQTAAEADHAILATFKFPKDTAQVEIRDGVIIVNLARAVAIAQILRKHLLHVHGLRLSKTEGQGLRQAHQLQPGASAFYSRSEDRLARADLPGLR